MSETTQIAAEFQALPLEFLIAAPLLGAVKAQSVAAEATKAFIESMLEDGKPITVDFKIEQHSDSSGKGITVQAPLLALVPVPHLRIDSITSKFHFEITQTYRDTKATDKSISLEAKSGALLSPWVKASLKGSASSKSTQESSTNRSGSLEVTVTASEAAIPEGLARILSLMTNAIQTPDQPK